MNAPRKLDALRTSLACTLLGALSTAATPVKAVTFAGFDSPVPAHDLLLYGSLTLLVVAVAIRFAQGFRTRVPEPSGPDLRWWKTA